jgi:sugar-phosphatase
VKFQADAILFDNDGVLVDSHHQVELAWRQLAAEFRLDYDMLATELVGARAVDTLGRYLSPGETTQAVARLEDLEVELAASVRPMAGALDLIGRLPALSWTIVTSASLRLATARWAAAGITIPARIVTAEDVSRGKPDPGPFLEAARLLGVDPSRCLVFEDSSPGGVAATAAGTKVVAVGSHPWTTRPEARVGDLTQVTATYDSTVRVINVQLALPQLPS